MKIKYLNFRYETTLNFSNNNYILDNYICVIIFRSIDFVLNFNMSASIKRPANSVEENPIKLSTFKANEHSLNKFKEWIAENSFNLSPKVCINCHFDMITNTLFWGKKGETNLL